MYPSVIDYTKVEDDAWFSIVSDSSTLEYHWPFHIHGEYVDRNIVQDTELYYFDNNTYDEEHDFTIESCVYYAATVQYHERNILLSMLVQISKRDVQPEEGDYNSLCPLFGWLPDDIIKQTFLNTTQYACMSMSALLKINYK